MSKQINTLVKHIRGIGFFSFPKATGKPLTHDQIDQIGHTLYRKFYHQLGMPVWKDLFAESIRNTINNGIKEVIDSMISEGYIITPKGANNENRGQS